MKDEDKAKIIEKLQEWKRDPFLFIGDMWGYKHKQITKEDKFEKGQSLTWQQVELIQAYKDAIETFDRPTDITDLKKRQISVRSGHGTSKTSTAAMLTLHFLLFFKNGQTQITANSEKQLRDIFMSRFNESYSQMPDALKDALILGAETVRVVDNEEFWFLRARTASPDNPAAIAGLHAPYVFLIVDEASEVDARCIEALRGCLSGQNWIYLMLGNPTRSEGSFYNTFKEESGWTNLHWNGEESPLVSHITIESWKRDYPPLGNAPSEEYKVRVLGEFPDIGNIDDKGWVPLFAGIPVEFSANMEVMDGIMGVDPAGAGRDRTIVVIRDSLYIKEILNEAQSTDKGLARSILELQNRYKIKTRNIIIDAFGVGARVVNEYHNPDDSFSSPVAVLNDLPSEIEIDRTGFATVKAELAWKFRNWLRMGGKIISTAPHRWKKELDLIKFKRDTKGRVALQSKKDFVKDNGFSPDLFDAALYTFVRDINSIYDDSYVDYEQSQAVVDRSDPLYNYNNYKLI
jgi:hypothetical protein